MQSNSQGEEGRAGLGAVRERVPPLCSPPLSTALSGTEMTSSGPLPTCPSESLTLSLVSGLLFLCDAQGESQHPPL